MMFDYATIKEHAREWGLKVSDFIALSNSNDPFYSDAPARRASAEWFAKNWVDLFCATGSHLRRIHYKIISQPVPILKPNGKPYLNTNDDWKFLCGASLNARYLKLIPKGSLIDRRNNDVRVNARRSPENPPTCQVIRRHGIHLIQNKIDRDIDADVPTILLRDPIHVNQPHLTELWIEKSTMDDILVPLSRRLGFNLISGMGELSEIHADQAVDRALEDGRPMRILYVSDFDPAGRSMPKAMARKIEYWIAHSDRPLDITLEHILLTPEQCADYNLPETPIKDTEKRGPKFKARFGRDATELDALEALHPGEFERIVREAVERYVDTSLQASINAVHTAFNRQIIEVERQVLKPFSDDLSAIKERFSAIVDRFESDVAEIEEETDELWPKIAAALEAAAPTFDPDELPKPRPALLEGTPLFDSKRPFLEQMRHYKAWSDVGTEDAE